MDINFHYCVEGDVESNPGPILDKIPFLRRGEDPVEKIQDILDDQADEINDLKDIVEKQTETINGIRSKVDFLFEKLNKNSDEVSKTREALWSVNQFVENEKKDKDRHFARLSENDAKLGQDLLQQKVI